MGTLRCPAGQHRARCRLHCTQVAEVGDGRHQSESVTDDELNWSDLITNISARVQKTGVLGGGALYGHRGWATVQTRSTQNSDG